MALLHPERRDKVIEAEQTLDRALPQLSEAAGGPVRGMVPIRHDPMDSIEDAVRNDHFDESCGRRTEPFRLGATADHDARSFQT